MADERCGNTIHSDYVTDHRCVKPREHLGDCWFGFGIPHLRYVGSPNQIIFQGQAAIMGLDPNVGLYQVVAPPYATVVSNQDSSPRE